eukprot:3677917-Amphidinium_carterae.1
MAHTPGTRSLSQFHQKFNIVSIAVQTGTKKVHGEIPPEISFEATVQLCFGSFDATQVLLKHKRLKSHFFNPRFH